jgi:hypothetical protein
MKIPETISKPRTALMALKCLIPTFAAGVTTACLLTLDAITQIAATA